MSFEITRLWRTLISFGLWRHYPPDSLPYNPGYMWERTLQDLIRGLRANKKDEAKFINQAVDEIRQEIRSKDMELKAGAVMKLTYVCAL